MRSTTAAVVAILLCQGAALGQGVPEGSRSLRPYLLDQAFEIALARSAAPVRVSARASLLVLRLDGYERIHKGSNGFTCLVQRSWSTALIPENPDHEFWDPRLRLPVCYNEEASRTVLAEYLRRTELTRAGKSKMEMRRAIDADLATGRLRAPWGPAMGYMLSAGQYFGERVGRFKPHIMLYVPYARSDELGARPWNGEQPLVLNPEGGPLASIVVPVAEFVEVQHTNPLR